MLQIVWNMEGIDMKVKTFRRSYLRDKILMPVLLSDMLSIGLVRFEVG
jgi:hypothetical protein